MKNIMRFIKRNVTKSTMRSVVNITLKLPMKGAMEIAMGNPTQRPARTFLALIALGGCLSAPPLAAQETGPAPIFQSDETLRVRITAPFAQVLASRGEDADYFPARLAYLDADGREVESDLEIKTRGNFRNRENICRFPPLMLDFPRSAMDDTLFAGENRLKLVTHCQPRTRYDQYVLLEYLSYRAFNLLSDTSLRVRLLELEYVDGEDGDMVASAPGFLIESVESLAARRSLAEVSLPRIRREWHEQRQLLLVTVFEYLLGSADWSAVIGPDGEECCHNLQPLQDADGAFVAVPYDFDMTGIVNPSYGSPPRQLGIRRFTQRLYRGVCPDPALLAQTLALFEEKRAALRALFEGQAGLNEDVRAETLTFFDGFYEVIGDSERLQSEFMGLCA